MKSKDRGTMGCDIITPSNFNSTLDECNKKIEDAARMLNEMERRGPARTPAEEKKIRRELKAVDQKLAEINKELAAIN